MAQDLEHDKVAGRAPLTRRRILVKALELVDRDGLDALSMRKLAAELGASAMSLYNHVPSKDAVLEGIVEVLLGEIDTSVTENPDWAEGLKAAFQSFREALLAHPNVVPLIALKQALSPEAFRPVEVSLATLRRAGFAPEDALRAHWSLVGFTLGHVGWQVSGPLSDESEADLHSAIVKQRLPAEEFPCLHEVVPFMMECDMNAAFEFGLDALLVGLKAQLGQSQ